MVDSNEMVASINPPMSHFGILRQKDVAKRTLNVEIQA